MPKTLFRHLKLRFRHFLVGFRHFKNILSALTSQISAFVKYNFGIALYAFRHLCLLIQIDPFHAILMFNHIRIDNYGKLLVVREFRYVYRLVIILVF